MIIKKKIINEKNVSIIIPYYLRLKKLEILLKSLNLLNYSPKLIEIILIVDGSKIDQIKIAAISKFKIRIILNKYNKGVSFSRNAGIISSKNNYLWFLDSDAEIVSSDTLNQMFSKLEKYKVDGITGYFENFESNSYVQTPIFFLNMIVIEKFIKKEKFTNQFVKMVAMTSVFIKKELLLSKLGFFDERLVIKEDEELISRSKNNKFLISEKCLVKHNPELKNDKNILNHLLDIIEVRRYTFEKNNKIKLLLVYDLFCMPVIIFMLLFNKQTTSRRASSMNLNCNINKLMIILISLLKSYINLSSNKINK